MNILLHDDEKGEIWIGQPIYTENLWKKYGMENSKPAKMPMDPSETFMKSTDLDERFDQHLYQSAIGSLSYLSVTTRPDITYSVNKMAKFCVDPSRHHWTGVKHILRYLKGTIQLESPTLSNHLENVWHTQMLTGEEISMTACLLQDICL